MIWWYVPGRIRQFLRKLFPSAIRHGRVIPEDARVDPGQFPPDEFPLYCPNCDYLLRGLEVNRCPECGRPFDPGRLLVEQYVIHSAGRRSRGIRRIGNWLLVLGCLAGLGVALLLEFQVDRIARDINPNTFHQISEWRNIVFPIVLACWVLVFVGAVLTAKARDKSKRVFDTIDESAAFKKDQRKQWRTVPLVVIGILGAVTLNALFNSRDYDFYARNPWRVLIPIGLAAGANPQGVALG